MKKVAEKFVFLEYFSYLCSMEEAGFVKYETVLAILKDAGFFFHAIADIHSTYNFVCIDEPRPGIGYVEDVKDVYDVRLANNMEKKMLYDALARKKYKWNPELNRLEYTGEVVVIDNEMPF